MYVINGEPIHTQCINIIQIIMILIPQYNLEPLIRKYLFITENKQSPILNSD